MIALILLILAVVVIGGGIEVVRRMRFGGGAAAAHHRALDTLGQLTNQGADRRVDLAPAAGSPMLDHVRRVVEADPTHPRISPKPISRPVAIPAAMTGNGTQAAAPEEVVARPAPAEIEGVRVLLPDPPITPSEDIEADGLEAADKPGVDAGGADTDEIGEGDKVDAAGPGEYEGIWGDDEVDADRGEDDRQVVGADGGAAVVARPDDDEPDVGPIRAPVGAISLADRRSEGADGTGEAPVAWASAWASEKAAQPDDLSEALAGTPVAPPTSADGAESVRVVGVDEVDPAESDDADRPPLNRFVRPPAVGEPVTRPEVTVPPPSSELGAVGAPPGLGEVEGFRILAPSEADSTAVASDASETATALVAAVSAPPALEDPPWRLAGAAPAAGAGAFHPAAPEQTRAQLAALARSGRVEPVGGGGRSGSGAQRSHNRRSRRSGGHARSTRHPVRHRGLRAATATLAVVVAAVGVISAVVISNQVASNPRAARPFAPVTAAPPTTTTVPAMPASLISKTASTATYQLTGAPTINFVGSGSCWIEIRQGDQAGKILFQGVLSSGSQKSQTGPFWVRLGNPAAISVQINGKVLNQPANTTDNPYNLQFQ